MAFINGQAGPDGLHDEGQPGVQGLALPVGLLAAAGHLAVQGRPQLAAEGPGRLDAAVHASDRHPGHHPAHVAEALLDAWPNVADPLRQAPAPTRTSTSSAGSTGRRTAPGSCSASSASATPRATGCARPRWRPAPGHYVAPATAAGITAALALAQPGHRLRPFALDQADVRRSARRPTPARWSSTPRRRRTDLDQATAKRSRSSSGSDHRGPAPGRGNGELPDGYLPITSTGVTATLYHQAQQVADAVAAQKAPAEDTHQRPHEPVDEPAGRPDVAGRRPAGPPRCRPAGLDAVDRPGSVGEQPRRTAPRRSRTAPSSRPRRSPRGPAVACCSSCSSASSWPVSARW